MADPTEVEAVIRTCYGALEQRMPLERFYVTDEEAGELGPVVKMGSGKDEVFLGYAATAEAVRKVGATFAENRLESRGPLLVRAVGDVAWFADTVWWSGRASGEAFASLTRWTGICLRTARGWRFLQLHVSEEVDG